MTNTLSDLPLRLAVWSGPRNISTATMRSWGNRKDTIVIDEPFYAHYLAQTGIDHPGRDVVLAHQENDWEKVLSTLLGPIPNGKTVFYQKHMAHHLLANMHGEWMHQLQHTFLIRRPDAMLASLTKVTPNAELMDTGLPQQLKLFEAIKGMNQYQPVIIDSIDLLRNPEKMLQAWCSAVGLPFDSQMLHWPAGLRDTDGIWASFWYGSVEQSTGFQPYQEKHTQLPEHLHELYESCKTYYDALYAQRLKA